MHTPCTPRRARGSWAWGSEPSEVFRKVEVKEGLRRARAGPWHILAVPTQRRQRRAQGPTPSKLTKADARHQRRAGGRYFANKAEDYFTPSCLSRGGGIRPVSEPRRLANAPKAQGRRGRFGPCSPPPTPPRAREQDSSWRLRSSPRRPLHKTPARPPPSPTTPRNLHPRQRPPRLEDRPPASPPSGAPRRRASSTPPPPPRSLTRAPPRLPSPSPTPSQARPRFSSTSPL